MCDELDNCVYCPNYKPIHSPQCQGYMCYCTFLKRKINVYEDYKNCGIKNKCENCERLKTEISNLELRIEELEEQVPEESFSHTRRTMMEDYD